MPPTEPAPGRPELVESALVEPTPVEPLPGELVIGDPRSEEVVADPAEMRRVLGLFASGVVIVTGVGADGGPAGFACQSFASVSLDPPLVLFCPARSSTSWTRIASSGRFVVNVLAADQQEVSAGFARSGVDKFAGLAWHPSPWGPVLDGVLATVQCTVDAVHPAGDHEIVVGRVRQLLTHREHGPLLFFRGGYGI